MAIEQQAKHCVIDAATRLFATQDERSVTIKQIAKAASDLRKSGSISESYVLKMFGSKDSLKQCCYESLDARAFREWFAKIEEWNRAPANEAIDVAVIQAHLLRGISELKKSPFLAEFVLREMITPAHSETEGDRAALATERRKEWLRRIRMVAEFLDKQAALRGRESTASLLIVVGFFFTSLVWFSCPSFIEELDASASEGGQPLMASLGTFSATLLEASLQGGVSAVSAPAPSPSRKLKGKDSRRNASSK